MDETYKTQKEVGQKYRDNLGYFKRPSFLLREKFYLSVLFLILGVTALLRLQVSPEYDRVYNPAPLSIAHARFESNCAACHAPAAKNVLGNLINATEAPDSSTMHHVAFSSSNLINQSCQNCHAGMDLHQPTAQTMELTQFHSHLHVVTAEGCFQCHQEHLGRINLATPGDTACAACHNDVHQMSHGFLNVALKGPVSKIAFDATTPDGVVHFIPPERTQPLHTFATFEKGHPPFEYQQSGLKNPDVLTFSHRQHLTLQGQKLQCIDCHKPSGDGIYYQRITYADSCQRCHTLQFDPANPQLTIPHGDVARLRAFLHSLPYQYEQLDLKLAGPATTPDQQRAFAVQQITALLQRANVQSPGDLEHEILFTGNPYKDAPPTTQRPYFSGCAYCHQVTQPAGGGDPIVTPPQFADRWLSHGAFTHAKHVFMSCTQCHAAEQSGLVTDIMMPTQSSCTECHRAGGTAPSSCLACHSFHAPQSVHQQIEALLAHPAQKQAANPSPQLTRFLVSDASPNH
jgi:mono/diheme cytochrome c family protein